jgi:hypothetical protein
MIGVSAWNGSVSPHGHQNQRPTPQSARPLLWPIWRYDDR